MTTATSDVLPLHLRSDREVHVIVSTLSGQQQAQGFYDGTLKPLLDSHEVKYVTHTTTSAQSVVNVTKTVFVPNAMRQVKQTIILLSGDGGVVDIVNTLSTMLIQSSVVFFKPALVLIPMGTANALAWSSGVASKPLEKLMNGTPQSLPSFVVRFSPGAQLVVDEGRGREPLEASEHGESVMFGAVVFSWGLHASLVAMSDTAEYRTYGIERFKMAAQRLLQDSHMYRGKVFRRTGGDALRDLPGHEHAYILASLVSNLEEHFQISPGSKPLDGSMHLVAIGPEPAEDIMKLLGLAYQSGAHVADARVSYESIDCLRIEFDEDEEVWRQVCVDGKIVAVPKDGWAEVSRMPATGMDARRVVELIC